MKIEKGICLPSDVKQGRPAKYPFREMEVGDSIFFVGAKSQCREYQAAIACGRRSGYSFSGRLEKDGYRIWRIE